MCSPSRERRSRVTITYSSKASLPGRCSRRGARVPGCRRGDAPIAGELSELIEGEREVLELVAAGMSNEQVAERLFLSIRTVERHLSNIYAKLRLSGKSARAGAPARFSRTR